MLSKEHFLLFAALCLSACSQTKPLEVIDISPKLARMGHADNIRIELDREPPSLEVAVLPGGPYINAIHPERGAPPPQFPRCYQDNDKALRLLSANGELVVKQALDFTGRAHVVFGNGCAVLTKDQVRYYAADGKGFSLTSSYQLDTPAWDMRSHQQQLLIADGTTGLTVLEAHGKELRWAGSYNKLGDVRLVAAEEQYALVADHRNTLSLISLQYEGTPRLISDFQFPAPIKHIELQGLQARVHSEKKVYSVDFSSLATPALSHLGVNLGGSRRAFLEGDIIYVADWFSGMHIYDISIANSPRLISSLHTPGSPKGVVVRDDIAYIADDDHGLQIADVRNKRRPQIIAALPLSGLAYTMKLIKDRLYVASHRGGLHIVDVSQPHKPRLLGSLDTPGKAWAVHVKGNLAYVADDDSGVLVVDVTQPEKMRVVGNFTPGGHAEDILIRDNIAYVAFFEQGLFVLDITQPHRPREIAHLWTPGNARGLQLEGDTLYLAAWKAGLQVIDVTQAKNPRIIGHYDTKGALWGLEQRDNIVYGLDWWGGLKTIDVSQPHRPKLTGQYQAAGKINRIVKQKNYLYLAASQRGLQVFDGTNPLNPVWATGVDIDGNASDVVVDKDTAFVAVSEQGVARVDIGNPFHASWKEQLHIPRGVDQLALSNGALLAAKTNETLVLLDTRGDKLSIVDYLAIEPKKILANDTGFFVLDTSGKLSHIKVNLSSPLIQINNITQLQPVPDDMVLSQKWLLTYSSETRKISRFQLTDFALKDAYAIDDRVGGMQFYDDKLFVAQPGIGLSVINYSGDGPRMELKYPGIHHITAPLISEQAIFLGGENIIVSGERLPSMDIQQRQKEVILTLSRDMPTGAYHVRLFDGKKVTTTHNAFEVGFKKPAKSRFTLEDLKKKMEQGNFEGKAP